MGAAFNWQAASEGIEIEPDHAAVTFGGGFYHCGWDLVRQPGDDNATTCTWILSFTHEDSPARVLQTFTAPVTSRFSDAEFIAQAIKELKVRAGKDVFGRVVVERITFMLAQGLDQAARDSVRQCAAQYPGDWRDHLLLYLLDRQINSQAAAISLRGWAQSQDTFDRWIIVSYAFAQAGDVDEMRSAVDHALSRPLTDDADAPANARYLGLPMCEKLYEHGSYATCIKLCDALAAYNNGPGASAAYLQGDLARIRTAAVAAMQPTSQPSSPVQFPTNDQFDPFAGIDLPRLIAVGTTQPDAK